MKSKLKNKSKEELIEICSKCFELLKYLAKKTRLGKVKEYNNYINEIFK